MVFYRKYRPQTIEELDSQKIRETLYAVLAKSDTHHAFLFTGPKGLGKTSTARIVAKVLNCQAKSEKRKAKNSIEPCNTCNQCLSITNGTNMDVLEIDAASNRGIDEIRSLRETIRLLPVSALRKVYIIDEVHMLTTEAFNALLKTLEEPPPHAVFVLCTTEPHKVPSTILSRCLHIPFTVATEEELVRSLRRIVTGEKISIEDEALLFLSKLADGSFRDGAKILEEVSAVAHGKKITSEIIEQQYKLVGVHKFVTELMESLAEKNAKQGIFLIGEMVRQGVDMTYCIDRIIEHLHNMLLMAVDVVPKGPKDIILPVLQIKELVILLTRAKGEQKYAVLPQLPLELAVIEWSLYDVTEKKDTDQVSDIKSQDAEKDESKEKPKESADIVNQQLLKSIIDKVKTKNHSVAGLLRSFSVKNFDGKELTIETAYKFHKDRLEKEDVKKTIEIAAEGITGKKIKVSVILKK